MRYLSKPALASRVQDFLHLVRLLTIHDDGRGALVNSLLLVPLSSRTTGGLKQRNMKGGWDTIIWGKSQTVRYWCDLSNNLKCTHVPGIQLLAWEPKAKVFCREPDPLSWSVSWTWPSVTVSLFPDPADGALEVHMGSIPCFLTSL